MRVMRQSWLWLLAQNHHHQPASQPSERHQCCVSVCWYVKPAWYWAKMLKRDHDDLGGILDMWSECNIESPKNYFDITCTHTVLTHPPMATLPPSLQVRWFVLVPSFFFLFCFGSHENVVQIIYPWCVVIWWLVKKLL